MLRLWWIAMLVLVLDQATKQLAIENLLGHPGIDLAPMLKLVLVYNTGAAFGFLNDAGGWQNILFITVAAVAAVAILFFVRRLRPAEIQTAVGLLLILGGALGNLVDRVRFGYVVDFIDVYYRAWHWPAFNVADSAITVGATLLVLDALGLDLCGRRARAGARR